VERTLTWYGRQPTAEIFKLERAGFYNIILLKKIKQIWKNNERTVLGMVIFVIFILIIEKE
jgi:hypothetical protein